MLLKELTQFNRYVLFDVTVDYDPDVESNDAEQEDYLICIDAVDDTSAKRIEAQIRKYIDNDMSVSNLGEELYNGPILSAYITDVKVSNSIPKNMERMMTEQELKDEIKYSND